MPEQQPAEVVQLAPVGSHAAAGGVPHTGGFEVHAPLLHWNPAVQPAPSASGALVHTCLPLASGVHAPAQQSDAWVQSAPGKRHGPGPTSQRWVLPLQTPQHPAPPPELQSSPAGRHGAACASAHFLSFALQTPEQH
jgi:hypothetical protein